MIKRVSLRLLAIALLAAILCINAFAQRDPGTFQLFQNGRLVGQIYVPARSSEATMYTEHWILYPGYVYPSAANTAVTEIVANSDNPYTNEADFLRRIPAGPGYRHVTVASYDTTAFPGR